MFSRRFGRGTPDLDAIRHAVWDATTLAMRFPVRRRRAEIAVRGLLPPLPIIARREKKATVRTTVRNASDAPLPAQASYGRRLVRLGRNCATVHGHADQPRFRTRPGCTHHLEPGDGGDRHDDHPAEQPGRYTPEVRPRLEGIDWFEACGSPTTTKTCWSSDDPAPRGALSKDLTARRQGRKAIG